MKKKVNKINLIFVIIQYILTFSCLILGVLYLFGSNALNLLRIVAGIDLILMGITNYLVYKKRKIMFIYLFFGIVILVLGILSIIGVV